MKHILIACLVFALCLARGAVSLLCACVRRGNGHASGALHPAGGGRTIYRGSGVSAAGKAALGGPRDSPRHFLHHEEVDEILALFAQLEAFIKLEDLDDYLAACGGLTARLEHVRRMELPTVERE